MKSIKKKVSGLLIASTLVVGVPLSVQAKGNNLHNKEKHKINYVALGDSLAAGQTPYHQLDKSYADYLVKRFEQSQYSVSYNNFGVSRYTSENLKNDILNNKEVQDKIKNANLITIDIGANDLLAKLKTDPTHVKDSLLAVANNLQIILQTIDSLNPNVKVLVMGYYNPFPHYSQEQQASLLPLLEALNKTIEDRSIANGDKYVPTAQVIKRNEDQYVPNSEDIHLNLEGYQVVAKEFWKNTGELK
ncbi:GDSL-type esterase/lipase family protein [Priestia megaterium]|uniref:GDSL-type esterase/lipase family protein n=1 Tax=Priestia megaterium TaxID=1404 RepID=UPI002E237D40|nr:GDSL-type esterase/lipase family protein [Priestia megaterium]